MSNQNNRRHKPRCGLCNIEIENWEKHIKSKSHQNFLANPEKMQVTLMQSQGELMKRVGVKSEVIKGQKKKKRNGGR